MTHCVARIRTPQGAVLLRCCSSGLRNRALSKVVKNEGPKKSAAPVRRGD
jgi:hypothetical protein